MMAPEEQARANLYGLLARLLYAPPDAGLLQAMAGETFDGELAEPWDNLKRAAAAADPEAVREEYETAFIGTGKAPVTLYTSAYSIRFSNEVPLAQLRSELARLGLSRRAEAVSPRTTSRRSATSCGTLLRSNKTWKSNIAFFIAGSRRLPNRCALQ